MAHKNRWLKYILGIAGVLVLLCLLAVAWVVNDRWTARKAWEAYADSARAKGVKLTYAEFLPPTVPPEDNYVVGTIFEWAGQGISNSNDANNALRLPSPPEGKKGKTTTAERLDGARAAMAEAGWLNDREPSSENGAAVLQGLERFRPEQRALREARSRTGCSFARHAIPPDTELPQLGVAIEVAAIWALCIDAHLALKEPAEALDDFLDGARLYQALVQEPTMIGHIARMSVLTPLVRSVEGGIAGKCWRDEDLQRIGAELDRIDLVSTARLQFASERGYINDVVEWQRRRSFSDEEAFLEEVDLLHKEPRGWRLWFRMHSGRSWREQLRDNKILDQRLKQFAAGADHAFDFSRDEQAGGEDEMWTMTEGAARRLIAVEMQLRESRLACALERFRLKQGSYPESLAELAPSFISAIPVDVIDGQPTRYRRAEPDQFLLYSIGANGRDDGGSPKADPHASGSYKAEDWVWNQSWN